jgi:4-amino-4-deoxy-L-arabinose transferase-like glycosyltransferase
MVGSLFHRRRNTIRDLNASRTPNWVLALTAIFFCVFLIGGNLVLNSREVADFHLAESLLTGPRFDIPFIEGTGDLATFDDKFYLDRGPGNALFAAPFFLLGKTLTAVGLPDETARLQATRLGAAFFAAAGLLLFMRLCLRLGASSEGTLIAALALGLGTIYWRYATIFYSHITAAFLVLAALWLLLELRERPGFGRPFLLGLVLGAAVLVEYGNALLVLVFLVAVLFAGEPAPFLARLRRLLPVVLGGLGPLAFLLFYHWVCFDSPFSTGFQHQVYFDYNKSGEQMFSTPWSVGVPGLLFSLRYQGFLYASPIALFGLGGLVLLYRRARLAALVAAGGFVALLLFYARYRVFWGATSDTRYLVPVIPLVFLGVPWALSWVLDADRAWGWRAAGLVAFALFFGRSIFWAFLQTAAFYHHPFDTTNLLKVVLLNDGFGVSQALRNAFPSLGWALPFCALALAATGGLIALRLLDQWRQVDR